MPSVDAEDANYKCSLDAATEKKAKDELNEVPSDRLAAVKTLRDWVKAQPHIHYPELPTEAMLLFLRGAKFSQIRAREMFEGNLSLKHIAPEWFCDLDSRNPEFLDIIDTGYVLPLPKRTKDGCAVLLYKLGAMKPNKYPYHKLVKAGMIVGGYMMQDESTQVNGTHFIFDFTGVTAGHMTSMMDRKDMAKWQKFWQKNVPGRFKGFHYYNAGMFFETLMVVARPFMPKKYQDRIRCHDTAESLYQYVEKDVLPEEFLPDDYNGPHAGSLADIIKNFKAKVTDEEFHKKMLYRSGNDFFIEMEKKPTTTEVTGHFRKLTVD